MFEKPPKLEQVPSAAENAEKIPNKYEIQALFEKFAKGEKFENVKKLEDEKGLCQWDIQIKNEQGEVTEYAYMRDNRAGAVVPYIYVAFYDTDGFPVGGHSVAKQNEDGTWTETE